MKKQGQIHPLAHQRSGAGLAHLPIPEPLAYRITDACHALGIGRTSLYELVKSGHLKLIRISGRSLVTRSEIERVVRVGTPPKPPLP